MEVTTDSYTIYADMPTSIKAYTVSNSDGTYTIIINSRLSSDQQLKSYNHEIKHIKNGDYEKHSADMVEMFAHNITYKEPTHAIKITSASDIQDRIARFRKERELIQQQLHEHEKRISEKQKIIENIRKYDSDFIAEKNNDFI